MIRSKFNPWTHLREVISAYQAAGAGRCRIPRQNRRRALAPPVVQRDPRGSAGAGLARICQWFSLASPRDPQSALMLFKNPLRAFKHIEGLLVVQRRMPRRLDPRDPVMRAGNDDPALHGS